MRMSEAIRLGAMLRPKGTGSYLVRGKSCANGAALEACGVRLSEDINTKHEHGFDLQRLWPWLGNAAVCPKCQRYRDKARWVIAHLNDISGHNWTREAIADWVATVEPQEAEPQSVERPQPETSAVTV